MGQSVNSLMPIGQTAGAGGCRIPWPWLALRRRADTVSAHMSDQSSRSSKPSPALVALAAWIIPGSGYLFLKEKARGLTIGITILVLFFLDCWSAASAASTCRDITCMGKKRTSTC